MNHRSSAREDRPGSPPQARLLAVALLLYGLAVAAYFVLRYDGRWMEGDTSRITRTIEVMQAEGTLFPAGRAYPHGFGYQAVSVAITAATGLTLQTLQTVVYPFLAMLGLGLTALAFYTRVAREGRIAILAAILLFLQPDVLFVTLRGSHEKLDWPLMMIALLLLYQSVDQPVRKMAVYVGLFYVVVFAMIATNVFFASTFLTAVTVSLGLGAVVIALLKRSGRLSSTDLRRLAYITGSGGILIFTFMVYIYPLASTDLRELRTITDQVSALLLSFEIKGQPYENISFGWVSSQAYLGLTVFTWLLILTSFAEWLRRGKSILAGREVMGLRESLDWLLYAGFALQVAASIVVDFSGALGSNLQLRIFPGFTVLAVGLLARGLWRVLSLPWFQGYARCAASIFIGVAFIWFALASVFKATNEPALSNKWVFYSSAEDTTLRWTDQYLRHATIWSGFDERFRVVFDFNYGYHSKGSNTYAVFTFKPEDNYVLFSESERLRGLRLGQAMPSVLNWNRFYDNGDVQLYHRRALTPYQH